MHNDIGKLATVPRASYDSPEMVLNGFHVSALFHDTLLRQPKKGFLDKLLCQLKQKSSMNSYITVIREFHDSPLCYRYSLTMLEVVKLSHYDQVSAILRDRDGGI